MTESSRSITTGKVRSITVRTNVYNRGEDAFQATLTVTAPSRHLEIGRLFGSLNSVSFNTLHLCDTLMPKSSIAFIRDRVQ